MELEFHGDFLGHAQNLWRRFPEVFEVLGAPNLESALCVGAVGRCGACASERARRSIIEAVLPWGGAGLLALGGDAAGLGIRGGGGEPTVGEVSEGSRAREPAPPAAEAPLKPSLPAAPRISRLAMRRGFAVVPIRTRRLEEDDDGVGRQGSEASEAASEESMGTLIERIAVRHPMGLSLSLADGSPRREPWPTDPDGPGDWQEQSRQQHQRHGEHCRGQRQETQPDQQQPSWRSMGSFSGR